jgi:hypothetical protein
MRWLCLAAALLLQVPGAGARDEVSLRLGGKEVAISPELSARLADMAREVVARCGPNSAAHPHNFGLAAHGAGERLRRTLEVSRLYVSYGKPFESASQLGGTLTVSEVILGMEGEELFVGPDFTRHRGAVAEHLNCGYLASLELACLAELGPYLPARYRQTCARLERDAAGRIVLPPPDIAPSCS